jgi:hypothetical protein
MYLLSSPRVRGEGGERLCREPDEGAVPPGSESRRRPLTQRAPRADLSPHAGRGKAKHSRSRDAFFDSHPSYRQAIPKNLAAIPIFVRSLRQWRTEASRSEHGARRSQKSFRLASGNKGCRTPRDAVPQPPRCWRGARLAIRARLSAFHCGSRWAVVTSQLSSRPCFLGAFLPFTRREWHDLMDRLPAKIATSPRVLPAPACPSPGFQHPHRSSCRRADAQSRSSAAVTNRRPRAPRLAPPAGVTG